jgi:hypothetical protein
VRRRQGEDIIFPILIAEVEEKIANKFTFKAISIGAQMTEMVALKSSVGGQNAIDFRGFYSGFFIYSASHRAP